MEDAISSAVAHAVEGFAAAHTGTLTPAASPMPSSSFSPTPTNCDVSRIHAKARWLIRMLSWVQATLDDAEDMDITDEPIRDWLRELQEVADAAEDLLDEFPPEALRLGFVGDGGWTAGSITELPRQRKVTSEMARLHDQRTEDIVSRFMKIKKPEQALKLDYHKEQMDAESIYASRTTSSVIEEPHIMGRIEELAKIKQFLLSSDAEESRGSDHMDDHVSVMAIVGMGGLGKTTLAQLAYNDDEVNEHFQLKSWVCVSEDFDVIRLTKAMLQSLNVEASGLSELDPLQQKLVQKLKLQERLLLVLDDVWEAENLNIHNWDLLTAPLHNISVDTKIIMTTRSWKVSEMVPRTLTYDLGFLSAEDTLELFMQHAFEGRDPNLFQNLVAIGEEMAKKCKGVPLAAKTLGGLLRTKDDDEWNKTLESEVWNTTINQEGFIIPILRLSYQHLAAPLKRCFRYCSLFPKDYVFERNRIICMWMAQGYIKAKRRELMEDIGQRYIDNLLWRSFFQKCPWNPEGLQMHDLMHDLARCVSGHECYSMEGDKPCLIPSHVRHLSIFPTSYPCKSIILSIKDISEPKSFRSLLFNLSIFDGELQSDSYTRMEHLRVLDLGGVRLDRLPESIARLKHLHYLRIFCFFKKLPEFVGGMCHLQTLDLEGVCKLPSSISNLYKLRHLILRCSDIVEYPVGIGKLAGLLTLPGFYVSPKHDCAKFGELKDMNNIRGEFAIKGLENLADVNEAKKACLDKKRNISSLCLEWDPKADSRHIDEVLESLKPSVKLVRLQIMGFRGPSYPSWLGDQSFSRLGSINLCECRSWTSLPPLGQLPSLKLLRISEARAVEYIGTEFFSGGFPQLQELTLICLYNWKSWCGAQGGQCPKLKKLFITTCRNLESLSLINLGAVEDISIFNCPKLRCVPGNSLELLHLQRAQTIKIRDIYQVGLIDASHFPTAAPLEDQPCLKLTDVGQQEAEYMLGVCSYICRLTVRRCLNLTSLPLDNLSALEYVAIIECPELWITSISTQLWQLPSLQKIWVDRIHGAESITVLFDKSHLELKNVDQLAASFLLKEFSQMICRLVITDCANLTSLPLMELTALEYLEISECNQLQVSSGSLQLPHSSSVQEMKVTCIRGAEYIHVLFSPRGPEALETSCLEFTNVDQLEASFLLHVFSHMICQLTITRCANLTSLPWTDLTTLQYLAIHECPLFQLLDAEQLPSTLQVLCIYGNPYETEQCSQHQHFQRLKQVQPCSNKEGGEHNLYLVFRNVHDVSAASKFCSLDVTKIHTLDIEWDCCTNDSSNVTDSVTQEVLFNLYSLCISSKRLVMRGYTGSGFAGCYADFFSKKLRIDVFRGRLSYVSLLQCSKCDLAPLIGLPILQELYVEGASSLESIVLDCVFPYDDMSARERRATHGSIAFPCLQKLEFHDMPVWKEWLGTKEGDFPFLWKLVLKHCPKLRGLPHLPPGLKELILEGCEELRSLSSSSQGLKSLKSLWRLSVTNCPNLDFTATEGPPPRLELMSLTACPLLLAWCEGHPRVLASLSYLLVDGVQVSTEKFTSLEYDFELTA